MPPAGPRLPERWDPWRAPRAAGRGQLPGLARIQRVLCLLRTPRLPRPAGGTVPPGWSLPANGRQQHSRRRAVCRVIWDGGRRVPDAGSLNLSLQSDADERGGGAGGTPRSLGFFHGKAGQTGGFRRLAEKTHDGAFGTLGRLGTGRRFRRSRLLLMQPFERQRNWDDKPPSS